MVGIEKNNKEQKSQGKKPPKSSKESKLIKEAKANKPQPDQVADSKITMLGKTILEICKKPQPDQVADSKKAILGKIMVGIEKNNKEQKSQGKKPPEPSKVLKLYIEANEKKRLIEKKIEDETPKLLKKIRSLSKGKFYPDSVLKACIFELLYYNLTNKKNIQVFDIDSIFQEIDWGKLKESCADLFFHLTKIKSFKIYLKIIKYHHIDNIFKILVKYINNDGKVREEELEVDHYIMHQPSRTADSHLKIIKVLGLSIKVLGLSIEGREVRSSLIKVLDQIMCPKILYYLNTFTYCKLIERINRYKDYPGENIEEKRNLENLKIVEGWFSENRYDIPDENECLGSLELLNAFERRKKKELISDISPSGPDTFSKKENNSQSAEKPAKHKAETKLSICKKMIDDAMNDNETDPEEWRNMFKNVFGASNYSAYLKAILDRYEEDYFMDEDGKPKGGMRFYKSRIGRKKNLEKN